MDFGPQVILDAAGDPIGIYRDNQDPETIQRVHAIPQTNAKGDVILNAKGEPVMVELPLDHPRVTAALAAIGRVVDGTAIVEA